MSTTTAMPETGGTGAVLRLVQWLSPAFPVSAFAYSQGLEWAMEAGAVRDAATLSDWITDTLAHGALGTDAALLCLGLRPGADLDALDDLACALAPSAERLAETLEQGTAFAREAGALEGATRPARAYPVAVAEAARALGLPAGDVAALFLQAQAANLVSAAVRFLPLGQGMGQGVLAALRPAILKAGARAVAAEAETLATAAFGADMAGMKHETQDVRIFRT